MSSSSASHVRPDTIFGHARAIFPAMAMLAGMQLEVFTQLKDGPLTASEIASAIGVNANKLGPLLYVLVLAELLTFQDGRFGNTPEADSYLVQGRLSYLSGMKEFWSDIWPALLKTATSIRTGAPQHKHDFYAMSEEERVTFFRSQHRDAVAAGEQLATLYDFSRFGCVLEVGAGSGGVAVGICRSSPGVSMIATDLPTIIPLTRQFLEESGLSGRVSTSAVDILAEAPGRACDMVIMRNLLQVLSLENARAALRNIATSLTPGGTIVIVAMMLDNSRLSPDLSVRVNLVFPNVYDDGLIYTEGEYRALLADAGFTEVEVRPDKILEYQALISARMP
jgi:SAM-dependent methyltransferase